MALGKHKAEGGHKRGHSNMSHWSPTADVKREARKARRAITKRARTLKGGLDS